MATFGAALGVAAALALTRILSSLPFGVSPNDAGTFVATLAVLIGLAWLASYLPARRATRVDPIVVLRSE